MIVGRIFTQHMGHGSIEQMQSLESRSSQEASLSMGKGVSYGPAKATWIQRGSTQIEVDLMEKPHDSFLSGLVGGFEDLFQMVGFHIFVKTLSGNSIQIWVSRLIVIEELKSLVRITWGFLQPCNILFMKEDSCKILPN